MPSRSGISGELARECEVASRLSRGEVAAELLITALHYVFSPTPWAFLSIGVPAK